MIGAAEIFKGRQNCWNVSAVSVVVVHQGLRAAVKHYISVTNLAVGRRTVK